MHGLTLRASRTVLPRWLNSQPSLTPAACGEEGPIDRATRAANTSLVTTGRRPSTFHAKAYLRTEETRNLNIPFGESSPFRAERMSSHRWRTCRLHRAVSRVGASCRATRVHARQAVLGTWLCRKMCDETDGTRVRPVRPRGGRNRPRSWQPASETSDREVHQYDGRELRRRLAKLDADRGHDCRPSPLHRHTRAIRTVEPRDVNCSGRNLRATRAALPVDPKPIATYPISSAWKRCPRTVWHSRVGHRAGQDRLGYEPCQPGTEAPAIETPTTPDIAIVSVSNSRRMLPAGGNPSKPRPKGQRPGEDVVGFVSACCIGSDPGRASRRPHIHGGFREVCR